MNHNQTRLIDVAQDSVQRTGLKALSFRTLADEVGIKSSSVHYYFPEKSDLARTLIERYRDTLFAALRQITESNQSLRHQFLAFADIFDEVARINRICLCSMMAAEFELLNKQNQTLLLEVFADMEGWLERLFDRHKTELTTTLTAGELARMTLSGLEGALLIDRVMGNSQRLDAQKTLLISLMH